MNPPTFRDVFPFDPPRQARLRHPIKPDADGREFVPLSSLDEAELLKLCENFRAQVFSIAGKTQPPFQPIIAARAEPLTQAEMMNALRWMWARGALQSAMIEPQVGMGEVLCVGRGKPEYWDALADSKCLNSPGGVTRPKEAT
jgi:hypothetical protein